jgi:hypothetical protein
MASFTPGRGGSCRAIRPAKVRLEGTRVGALLLLLLFEGVEEEGRGREVVEEKAHAITRKPLLDIASLRARISARVTSSNGVVDGGEGEGEGTGEYEDCERVWVEHIGRIFSTAPLTNVIVPAALELNGQLVVGGFSVEPGRADPFARGELLLLFDRFIACMYGDEFKV